MVEDIDSIVRLDPSEQVHYEKEQNLYSIIKTIEYLVSNQSHYLCLMLCYYVGIRLYIRKGYWS